MIRTENRTVTQDGRDPWAVAREATERAEAALAQLRETQRVVAWAYAELVRLGAKA